MVGDNLALLGLGAIATGSSTYSTFNAGRVIDGNPYTYWCANVAPVAGAWLSIDLAAAKKVTGFRLYDYGGVFGATAYKAQQSANGVDWNDILTQTVGASGELVTFADAITSRYFRFLATAGGADRWIIYQIELYEGEAPLPPTPQPRPINIMVSGAQLVYHGAKVDLEALTGLPNMTIGEAIDTHEQGWYDGAAWRWLATGANTNLADYMPLFYEITENLSARIGVSTSFTTRNIFLAGSLNVYLNGLLLEAGPDWEMNSDYTEHVDLKGLDCLVAVPGDKLLVKYRSTTPLAPGGPWGTSWGINYGG